jgi:hypothetical protein
MGCGASSRVLPGADALLADDTVLGSDAEVRQRVAASVGVAGGLREQVWPVLLRAWDPRDAGGADERQAEFERLLAMPVDEAQLRVIEADVPRTDRDLPQWSSDDSLPPLLSLLRAHLAYAPAVGYYQGMNDVAAIFLDTLPRPCDAFFAFEGWVRLTAANWAAKLQGVWAQARGVMAAIGAAEPKLARHLATLSIVPDEPLPFLFQLLFLRLKREMRSYEEARRLWEVSWAACDRFDLFLARRVEYSTPREVGSAPHASASSSAQVAGIVVSRRAKLMRVDRMDLVHKLFMDLSGTLDAAPLIAEARKLHASAAARKAVAAIELDERLPDEC